jgi:uncharacterized protein (TIGR04255 family)
MNRRTYKKPPIEEALCEFRFVSQEWDLTLPGRLYDEIKDEYPGKPKNIVARMQLKDVTAAPAGQNVSAVQIPQIVAAVRLASRDARRLLNSGSRPFERPRAPAVPR